MPLPVPSESPSSPPKLPQEEKGDSTGGIIPYKNPHALTAYYLGLFSLIPVIGLILGGIAVPLGISGLKQRKKRPIIRGAVHAWVGIVFGGCSVIVHVILFIAVAMSVAKHR